MQTTKNIFIFFFAFFLLGAGQKLPSYDLVVESSRLKFSPQALSGPESARLNLLLDGEVIISSSCGAKHWVKYVEEKYTEILKKAEALKKMVKVTGSQLCTLSDNENTLRIKIVQ